MTPVEKTMEKITAYRAFGIFADYDGNAPDTDTIVTVTSEELAKQVCEKLNEDPRSYVIAFVDGWEHAKRFRHRPVLIANPDSACDSFASAVAEMLQE
jgi:hypothetical protein